MPTEKPATDKPLATLESSSSATLDGLLDDFSNSSSGWDVNSGAEGSVGYENGAYVIQVDRVDYSLWANPGEMFDDVVVEVTAQLTPDSASADMGVLCRYQDAGNFIYGGITSDGFYGIAQMKNGQLSVLTGGGKLQPSDVIEQGTQANGLRFLCEGNQFTLVVNDQVVDTIEAKAPAGGDVGLLAGTFEKPGARVRFDDFAAARPPTDSATAGVPSDNQVLYADDFSDPNSGWDVRSTDNGSSGYRAGRYFIRIESPKYQLWSTTGQDLKGDVVVDVVAAVAGGPEENEMGVLCRYQDKQNFVYGSVGSDGFYAIVEVANNDSTILTGEGKFQQSAAIPRGSETYIIRLACEGDRYTLFVNGEQIDSASSSAFSGGDVGLLAGAFDQGGVEVLFDDFSVSVP
ncbi:MAG: hypothetical protein HGB05_00480 [Chloroflexi bacterium]|nr:hypothetical protein [Chloroflexota bacterium]